MTTLGEFRLLYLQSSPEDGEKVCVGIAINDTRQSNLLYDSSLKRARCLDASIDIDLIRMLLQYSSKQFARDSGNFFKLAAVLGGQFSLSDSKQLNSPLSEEAQQQLFARFVTKDYSRETGRNYDQEFATKVQQFAFGKDGASGLQFRVEVTARDIVGHSIARVKKVALAILSETRATLIDGVDLTQLSPKRAISRVGKVNHTFWQYKQLQQQEHLQRKIQRVALVFNGLKSTDSFYLDAHDYASHQLRSESDTFIDTSKAQDAAMLADILAG